MTRTPISVAEGSDVRVCIAPFGWLGYVVNEGETLASIAQTTGISVSELRDANCLADDIQVAVGESLYIPGPSAVQMPLEATEEVSGNCPDPGVAITSPMTDAEVDGAFMIRGTADIEGFGYYRIDVRADADSEYDFYSRSMMPVQDGVLGAVNTRIFDQGLHWIRLTVVNQTGGEDPASCAIALLFE